MSACDPQTFTSIDRPMFERICAELAKQHPELGDPSKVPDSGSANGSGYTIEWAYIEAAGTLMVQCIDSPWWSPCAAINAAVQEMIDGARTTA